MREANIKDNFALLRAITEHFLGNKEKKEYQKLMLKALKINSRLRKKKGLANGKTPYSGIFGYRTRVWGDIIFSLKDFLRKNKLLKIYREDFIWANEVNEIFAPKKNIFLQMSLSDKFGLYIKPRLIAAFLHDDPRKIHAYLKGSKKVY